MLIVLWEDEFNFTHKKPPEGSINLKSLSSYFCFALVSKTGPAVQVFPTRMLIYRADLSGFSGHTKLLIPIPQSSLFL